MKILHLLILFVFCVYNFCSISTVSAEPLAPKSPNWIEEWATWLKQQHPDVECIDTNHCVWTGLLSISIETDQASFFIRGHADIPTWIELPGSAGTWPIEVQNNHVHLPVLPHPQYREQTKRDVPSVFVEKGDFFLEGILTWNTPPSDIRVPQSTGLFDIHFSNLSEQPNTTNIFHLENGELFLRLDHEQEKINSFSLEIAHKIQDGVPITVESVYQLQIFHQPQTIYLGEVQASDQTIYAVDSDVQYWLASVDKHTPNDDTPDTQMGVWIFAPVGEHNFTVHSIISEQEQQISLPTRPQNWTQKWTHNWNEFEYIVLEENRNFRNIQLQSLDDTHSIQAIASEQSPIPDKWKHLPTYKVHKNSRISILELRKGNPQTPPNQLQLSREIWPSLHDSGFIVQDTITGTMYAGWTLEPQSLDQEPLDISSATSNGNAQTIFLSNPATKDTTEDPSPHELLSQRNTEVQWNIISTTPHPPISGWNVEYSYIQSTIHIPPRWKCLYVFAPISNNSMQYLLLCNWVLVVAGIWLFRSSSVLHKILYCVVGVLGSFTSPWTILVWQILHAFCGKYKKDLLGVVAVTCAFFASTETLELWSNTTTVSTIPHFSEELSSNNRAMWSKDFKIAQQYTQQEDIAYTVQMGQSVPTWRGKTVRAIWPNGILPNQDTSLYMVLISSTEQYVALFFALGGMLLIGWRYHDNKQTIPQNSNRKGIEGTEGIMMLLCVLATSLYAPSAHAEDGNTAQYTNLLTAEQEKEVLEYIHQSNCEANCQIISLVSIDITEKPPSSVPQLHIALEIHSAKDGYITLPGPTTIWRPNQILVEGQPHYALQTNAQNYLEIRLEEGIYQIDMVGDIQDSLQLYWKDVPQKLNVSSPEWSIEGLQSNGTIDGKITIHRTNTTNSQAQREDAGDRHGFAMEMPQITQIFRYIEIGREWRMHNTIRRMGQRSAEDVFVPILPGEQPIQGAFSIVDTALRLSFAENEETISWTSVLDKTDQYTLVAPDSMTTTEQWQIRCGPQYQCTYQGLTPVSHIDTSHWKPTWYPAPKESLDIQIIPHAQASGTNYRINNVEIQHTLELQKIRSSMTMEIHASESSFIELGIPQNIRIQRVQLDGVDYPFTNDSRLLVPFGIGLQRVYMEWNAPRVDTAIQNLQFIPPTTNGQIHTDTQINNVSIQIISPYPIWFATLSQDNRFWQSNTAWNIVLCPTIMLFALLFARQKFSGISFVSWIFVLTGALQCGGVLGTLICALYWLQQRWSREDWKKLLSAHIILLALISIGALLLLIYPTTSCWFLQSSDLQWYTDQLQTETEIAIPNITTLPISTTWIFLGQGVWSVWFVSLLWKQYSMDAPE